MPQYWSIDLGIRGPYMEGRVYTGAGLSVIPGQLLEAMDDYSQTVYPNERPDQPNPCYIATEDPYLGTGIDHVYYEGDTVHYRHCMPGDVFLGWLAAGVWAHPNHLLVSAGYGWLKKYSVAPAASKSIIGVSLDQAYSPVDPIRIRVRVI